MEEKNYLVIEIYPMGGQRIIAQTEQIDDALLLLGLSYLDTIIQEIYLQ